MTADERALIRAIIAEPDDDLPRLVYADWLEENGHAERAEFIRIQCWLKHNYSGEKSPPDLPAMVARLKALEKNHVPAWRLELPVVPGVVWGDFRRGMIESARVLVWKAGPSGGLSGLLKVMDCHPIWELAAVVDNLTSLRRLFGWVGLTRLRLVRLSPSSRLVGSDLAEDLARVLSTHRWGNRPERVELRYWDFTQVLLDAWTQTRGPEPPPLLDFRRSRVRPDDRPTLVGRFGDRVLL